MAPSGLGNASAKLSPGRPPVNGSGVTFARAKQSGTGIELSERSTWYSIPEIR